jgi:membrane protein required for colicin V production
MSIDIIIIVVLLIAVFKGVSKGLVVAVFSFLAIIIGIAAAVKLSAVVAGWLADNTNINSAWMPVLSFTIVLAGVILLVRWSARIVESAFDLAMLGWVNKLAGAVLYLALYAFLMSVILFYVSKLNLLADTTTAESKLIPLLQPLGPVVIEGMGKVIPIFQNLFEELSTFFEKWASEK